MNFERVAAYIDTLGEKYGLSGVDCRVMKDHEVVFRRMWGWSDYDRTRPVTANDLYDVYSCTKVITMTACMQLVEAGLIHLDDPVEKFIPQFASMTVSDDFVPFQWPLKWPTLEDCQHPAPGKVTLRELMTMTSGLSYDLDSCAIRETIARTGGKAGTVELAEAIAQMPLLFDPGTRYSYSLGHDIMAAVVETATHQRYQDYLREHIFDPLGLKNMFMHVPESEKNRLSAQYGSVIGSGEIRRMDVGNRYRLTPNYDSGGAGLACTVDDYSLLLDALANGGVAFNGYQLLSQESIDEMRKPQLCEQAQADFARSGKVGYGYGLGVRTLIDQSKSKSPLGEFGWDGAAGAYALVDSENHLSIFYAQEVLGMMKAYNEIHPTLRDLVYEAIKET